MTFFPNEQVKPLVPGNSVNFRIVDNETLAKREKDAIKELRDVVFRPRSHHQRLRLQFVHCLGQILGPRKVLAILRRGQYLWEPPQRSVLVMKEDTLVGMVGMVVRNISKDGSSKRIGGICEVMTHPEMRGRGLASRAMQEAARHFREELDVSFTLLFCPPRLIPFYQRLMWKEFHGKVFVNQPEGKLEFTTLSKMVLDLREPAPLNGTLDLNGRPW